MMLETGSKLIMIGDSVTDCGRARPVGESGALGGGYPSMIDPLLKAAYPEQKIRVINMGISGNTVRDLKNRWQTDVLDLHPDYVSIMIGINDVWRQYDAPLRPEVHVLPDEYRATLDALVLRTKPLVKGIILMTPFYAEPNPNEPMRAMVDRYGKIVAETAARHQAVLVDTQAAFGKQLATMHPTLIAPDRVHPNALGHLVLAKAFLNAVKFAWERMYD